MAQWKKQNKFGIVQLINEAASTLEKVIRADLDKLKDKADKLERLEKMKRGQNGSMERKN